VGLVAYTGGMNVLVTANLVLLALLMAAGTAHSTSKPVETTGPQNFIFFNLDRQRIREPSFLENPGIVGAQLKYTWREVEPERDRYVLDNIIGDLEFLEANGKQLWIHLQEVSFDDRLNVPDYLVVDPEFTGGAAKKYEYDETREVAEFDGWVARRWDPAVIERLDLLFQAMSVTLDGRIAGINLAETSVGFGRTEDLRPAGYTLESYASGIQSIMTAAGNAFRKSHVIQYANFMPGEWLPWQDQGYLRGIYSHAERIGVGVGGPDLLPHRRGQQNHCQELIRERGSSVVAGLAVQWGNLEDVNPATGERVTVKELSDFARDSLRLDYVFWGMQEPYYTDSILPYLESGGLPKAEGP